MPRKRKNPSKGKRNPAKRSRTSNSFYTEFLKRTQVQGTFEETPEGILEYKNAAGEVVARQMVPEKVKALADQRGVSTEEILKERAETTAHVQMLEAIRIRRGLPAGTKLSLSDPEVKRMYVLLQEHGVHPYSEVVAREIVERYASGERLISFLGSGYFPTYSSYIRWKSRYPEFKKLMDEASVTRAEHYIAELEHMGDNVSLFDTKQAKVRIDVLKHLAAVHDPDRYGNRTKVVGDKNAPIAFTVVTGVPDQEIPVPISPQIEENPAIEVKGETVNEDPSGGSETN